MRILWVAPNFLHPTTKGGQIRSLNTLIELHKRHDILYAALGHSGEVEGPARASEYSGRSRVFPFKIPERRSIAFGAQLARGLVSPVPVSVQRFTTPELRAYLDTAVRDRGIDCVVCDFLAAAHNFSSLRGVTLFQHNVETEIWRRRVEHASSLPVSLYMKLQARHMFEFEKRACRESDMVLAVSDKDAVAKRRARAGSRRTDRPGTTDRRGNAPPQPGAADRSTQCSSRASHRGMR
jgi:hypothetical protein